MRNLILASAAAATAVTGIGLTFSTPAFAQAGTYQKSCRTYTSTNGVLTAECADMQGRYHSSSLATGPCRGDISNQNGMLSCPGGQASGGQLVQTPQQSNRGQAQGYGAPPQRDDRGDNRAAAAIAGAVAGALLGADGRPVAPPPVFGDQRYGDPRFDYRYQQGWWGYGHRPGEWVRIRDRADWLNMRIDRAVQQGRLDRRDARDLRRQLGSIEDMEDRYLRDGRLDSGERADLDRRFDDLSQRIRFESGPSDRDRYGDRDRGRYDNDRR